MPEQERRPRRDGAVLLGGEQPDPTETPDLRQPGNSPEESLPAWRRGISAAALMQVEFPPIRYVVPEYVVEGLTVIAGAPKTRKSWMVLDVCVAVAGGGLALGSIPCEQGTVLYLALEDNPRRLQDRLRKMGLADGPERLTLCTEWPDGDEALAEIEAWASAVENPLLVVVDTLARIRGVTDREQSYLDDYRALNALHDLALRLGIAIVVVHHTRKLEAVDPFDEVSGTRGITGAADTVLMLRRENTGTTSHRAKLYGRGRDIPEMERALEFDDSDFRWRVMGDSWLVAATVERQEIVDLLRDADGPMRLAEIAEELGKAKQNINKLLRKLVADGLVAKIATGTYAAVETGNPVNADEGLLSPELTE